MAVNYTPNYESINGNFKTLKPFRFWCQKVLPLVYDDSLSYYELLNKVVDYLNNTMEDVELLNDNVNTLDENVRNVYDAYNTLQNYVNNYFDNLDVQEEINNKLDAMVLDGTMTNIISSISTPLIPNIVADWLEDNITPSTPIVDDTLTISGAAADAKKTGDEISSVMSDLNDTNEKLTAIGNYATKTVFVESIPVLEIPNVVSSPGHYAAHATPGISMYANAGYNGCYFIADKEYTVFLDNDTITNNVMVGVGTGYTGITQHTSYYDLLCASNTVYRSQDGNAPRTPETAVTVPKGGVLAVSWAGDQAIKIYGFVTELTIGDPLKNDVENLIGEKNTVSGNGTNIDITCGKLKFQLRHIIDNSINVDCWRLYYGYILKDGVQYTLWGASDADGVIKLSGENDFLGGYHGDEITTGIRMLIDNVETNPSNTIESTEFENIDIFVSSNLFHDSNSPQVGVQCFTREKHIHFESNKMELLNVWTAVESVDVITAFVGMFSVDRVSGNENNFIIGYTTNIDAMLKGDNVATTYNANLHNADFYTKGGTIKMEDYGCFGGNYNAQVMYYSDSNRLKFYANNNPGQVSVGSVFAGGYKLTAE